MHQTQAADYSLIWRMDGELEEERRQKQQYLRVEILENNYDP